MNILLLEDSTPLARAMAMVLQQDNHSVYVENSPLTIVNSLTADDYDLYIIDLILPEIPGVKVIEAIRDSGINKPIIVATNMVSGFDRNKLKSLGVDKIIIKSRIEPGEFRKLVRSYA